MLSKFPVRLRTHLGNRPNTQGIFSGDVRSDLVELDVCGPAGVSKGFKPLVREGAFDASELSVMTFLQARSYGKPLTLLPATVLGRFQHPFLAVRDGGPIQAAGDFEGRRIGIRSYTVTTVTWLRAILQRQLGVDIDKVTWVAHEDSHLAEFRDPPNVERFDLGDKMLEGMLADGEIDAAILGRPPTNPAVKPYFASAEDAAREWYKKFGAIQLNHMFVVNSELAADRPELVVEIYDMLKRAAEMAPRRELGLDILPFGVEANRKNLQVAIDCAAMQNLIPQAFPADELFDQTTMKLN